MSVEAIVSSLVNNKFWDNDNTKYEDLRSKFIKGLRAYWSESPYRLKSRNEKSNSIYYEGLFGTGAGIKISRDTFPLKKDYDLKDLVKDYCNEYGIPVEIHNGGNFLYLFSNEYSRMSNEDKYGGRRYSDKEMDAAQVRVYGVAPKKSYCFTYYVTHDSKIPADENHKMKAVINDLTLDDLNEQFSEKCIQELKENFPDLYYKDRMYVNGMISICIISTKVLSDEEEKILYDYINSLIRPWKDDLELHYKVYNSYN